MEASKIYNVKDIVFASTSSVYGLSTEVPFKESTPIDSTISTYSASKRACELLCHTYHKLSGIRFRILRFFTVYGPWGRPDMALFSFTRDILNRNPIDVYNFGKMRRDFTYIDDITDGFIRAINSTLPFEIFNLGRGNPEHLTNFIKVIEKELGIKANKNFVSIQPGDMEATWADISKAKELLGFNPKVDINEGIPKFIDWYLKNYN